MRHTIRRISGWTGPTAGARRARTSAGSAGRRTGGRAGTPGPVPAGVLNGQGVGLGGLVGRTGGGDSRGGRDGEPLRQGFLGRRIHGPRIPRVRPSVLRLRPNILRMRPSELRLRPSTLRVQPRILRVGPRVIRLDRQALGQVFRRRLGVAGRTRRRGGGWHGQAQGRAVQRRGRTSESGIGCGAIGGGPIRRVHLAGRCTGRPLEIARTLGV
ncbi:hypothetical protein FMUBM48_54120 [Nocardia cyriacigeorgica]|nr:hypothetical protein FMUBM48_54120 [Nocardia cyriacigeorgica]